MRSYAQNRTTLGTDDQDAIRWLYGDGSPRAPTSSPDRLGLLAPTGAFRQHDVHAHGTNFRAG
jgi:hypothetical protein